ncbi:MAG: ribose 5-phosphate isomerase [Bacteroidota bacterium]|jgi:ribose 5-phosphate isomerase B
MNKSIPIGCDHAGFELKKIIIKWLIDNNFNPIDQGCYSEDSVDYPDFGHAVSRIIESGEADLGIVICGSGNGINMSVNKHDKIRGALCWEPEIAALARQHNDANVISIPARFISSEKAIAIIDTFLKTQFEGGRHQRRIEKISL